MRYPKTVEEIPTVMKEAMSAHEMFRRLGFTPSEIFLDISNYPSISVQVRKGAKKFKVEVGKSTAYTKDYFLEIWAGFCEKMSSGMYSDKDLLDIYLSSSVLQKDEEIVLGTMDILDTPSA